MTDPRLLKHAKALRKSMTDAEQRLWYHLRGHRFQGAKFKRQKPIGGFIVDFVCLDCGLVIELDGGQHADSAAYDQRRDAWLSAHGYRVLRFWNNQVMQELPGVLDQIRAALAASPSPPTPLPLAGEGSEMESTREPSHTDERSKTRTVEDSSSLPRVVGSGRRSEESMRAENKTALDKIQSRSADREKPNP